MLDDLYPAGHGDVARLRSQVIRKYGAVCSCCGERQFLFLTLDHVRNDGWAERRVYSPGELLRRVLREPIDRTRYAVLCFNCNYGKARNRGVCPHVRGRLRLSD